MSGTEQPDGAVTPGDEQRDGAGPPAANPTSRQAVHDWIALRVAADEQMRWAGTTARATAAARAAAQEEQS